MAEHMILLLVAVTVCDLLSLGKDRPLWVVSSGILYVVAGLALLSWDKDSLASNIVPCICITFGISTVLRGIKGINKTTSHTSLKEPPDKFT